jgi:hypothetical protein
VSARDDEAGDRSAERAAERARAEAEEQAWREIVDHYGEPPDVAELSDLTTVEPPVQPAQPLEFRVLRPVFDPDDAEAFDVVDDDEPFTPPPLPPPAVVTPEKRLAWVGLVASPLLIVLINLLDYALPGILTVGLVVAFLASFGYLVATMTPHDPDDDGARV